MGQIVLELSVVNRAVAVGQFTTSAEGSMFELAGVAAAIRKAIVTFTVKIIIFKLAGIKYGRIDYAIKENKIVVWEINSNPMIASSSSLKKSKRKPVHDFFASEFITVFKKLDFIQKSEPVNNPLHSQYSKKEIQNIFPYNVIKYWISTIYQNVKSIILFNFYSFKNIFFK